MKPLAHSSQLNQFPHKHPKNTFIELHQFSLCYNTQLYQLLRGTCYILLSTDDALQLYFERLKGVGICMVNLVDDIHEYMRGLFFIM